MMLHIEVETERREIIIVNQSIESTHISQYLPELQKAVGMQSSPLYYHHVRSRNGH